MKREGVALAMITLALVSGMMLMAATSGCDSKQPVSASAVVSHE